MNCPMMMNSLIQYTKAMAKNESDCIEDECAWWCKDYRRCAILQIAMDLRVLDDTIKKSIGVR